MSENKTSTPIEIAPETSAPKYTIEYILTQLEKIAADTTYLLEANKESGNPFGADMVGDARTIGLGNMIESREKTNQKLIDFNTEMYHDLKAAVVPGREKLAQELLKTINPCFEIILKKSMTM